MPALAGAPVVGHSGNLPLTFERNVGQAPTTTKFVSHAGGYSIWLSRNGITMRAGAASFQLRFEDASPYVSLEPTEELAGKSNYILGRDPKNWITGVAAFSGVRYHRLYPKVDLLCRGESRRFEYDFLIAPGADPRRIRIYFRDADSVKVDDQGELVVKVRGSEWRQQVPHVYQGSRPVAGRFVAFPRGRIGFDVGPYDHDKELVIDPVVVYGSYLGGTRDDSVATMTVDSSGSIYLAGSTNSSDFPITAGSYDPTFNGGPCPMGTYMGVPINRYCRDVFVTKLNPLGTALVFSTYVGGVGGDDAYAMAVDTNGNVYVTGATNSSDFPVTANALQSKLAGGELGIDAFVLKIDPSGSKLLYSSFVGGKGDDIGRAMAISSSGDLYIAGSTTSSDFPVVNALLSQFGGGDCGGNRSNELACSDAFLMRWRSQDMTLQYASFLGGNADDSASGVALDAAGNVYVAGTTSSANFPLTKPLISSLPGGSSHVFLAEIAGSGDRFIYCTLLGGSGNDSASAVAVDRSGNAIVTGSTSSLDFPVVNAVQDKPGGGVCQGLYGLPYVPCSHGFVAKVNSQGSKLVYSTYLSGYGVDSADAVEVDTSGSVWVAGGTSSRAGFPITPDAIHFCNSASPSLGGTTGFLTKLMDDGSLAYSTFFGGSYRDGISALALDGSGSLLIGDSTSSGDLSVTSGAFQTRFTNGNVGIYLAKVDLGAASTTGPLLEGPCILNAAAYQSVSASGYPSNLVAPGEIVTILGSHLGPVAGVAATVDAGGNFPTNLAGVTLSFNGLPAPLLYVDASQINAVVPFGVGGSSQAKVQLRYDDLAPVEATVGVTGAVPGIFTIDSTGIGQAAALNQDGTVNSSSNPAPRGSIVTIWATGLGLLTPPYPDGQIVSSALSKLVDVPGPFAVRVSGSSAEIQYIGQAPGMVAGVIQINLVVPYDAPAGPVVPVYIYEDYQSATIAVK